MRWIVPFLDPSIYFILIKILYLFNAKKLTFKLIIKKNAIEYWENVTKIYTHIISTNHIKTNEITLVRFNNKYIFLKIPCCINKFLIHLFKDNFKNFDKISPIQDGFVWNATYYIVLYWNSERLVKITDLYQSCPL